MFAPLPTSSTEWEYKNIQSQSSLHSIKQLVQASSSWTSSAILGRTIYLLRHSLHHSLQVCGSGKLSVCISIGKHAATSCLSESSVVIYLVYFMPSQWIEVCTVTGWMHVLDTGRWCQWSVGCRLGLVGRCTETMHVVTSAGWVQSTNHHCMRADESSHMQTWPDLDQPVILTV